MTLLGYISLTILLSILGVVVFDRKYDKEDLLITIGLTSPIFTYIVKTLI